MNSKFAAAIDPIFLCAIQAIEQLDLGQPRDAERLSLEFQRLFEQGDAIFGLDSDWQLAKYALVAWIDEMLVNHAWQGSGWWSNNVLEVRFFQSRLCSVRFFQLAKQAQATESRWALSVFYHCVILGFRGLYGTTGDVRELAADLGIPDTLAQWLKTVDSMLSHARPKAAAPPVMASIAGARPDNGRLRVLTWSLAATTLLVINLIIHQT